MEQRFKGVKVIVGVDRLDYIKGVPQKMHALELFLTQHPEWIGKVCALLGRSDIFPADCMRVIPGRAHPTCRPFPTRRRRIPESPIDCQ